MTRPVLTCGSKELVRMAKEKGLTLTGPDGSLKQFTKSVLAAALNEELTRESRR